MQKASDGSYQVNPPIGNASGYDHYDVGIINSKESYVNTTGRWQDYSRSDVREGIFQNPGIRNPAFDNFPIKGFCKKTDNDIRIRMTGKITVRKKTKKGTYTIKVKVTVSGNAYYKAGSKTKNVTVVVR